MNPVMGVDVDVVLDQPLNLITRHRTRRINSLNSRGRSASRSASTIARTFRQLAGSLTSVAQHAVVYTVIALTLYHGFSHDCQGIGSATNATTTSPAPHCQLKNWIDVLRCFVDRRAAKAAACSFVGTRLSTRGTFVDTLRLSCLAALIDMYMLPVLPSTMQQSCATRLVASAIDYFRIMYPWTCSGMGPLMDAYFVASSLLLSTLESFYRKADDRYAVATMFDRSWGLRVLAAHGVKGIGMGVVLLRLVAFVRALIG